MGFLPAGHDARRRGRVAISDYQIGRRPPASGRAERDPQMIGVASCLTLGPSCRGRTITTSAAPSGAFSVSILSERCPTEASVAIAIPSTKHAHGDLSLS